MAKVKLWFFTAIAVCCLCLLAYPVNSQPTSSPAPQSALIQNILRETGIARRYDMYLRNSVDIAVGPGFRESLMIWLHSLIMREAGWKQVEPDYARRLASRFSVAELEELQTIFKQPVVRKLLEAEAQSYASTARKRHELMSKLWDDYQAGKYNPPPGVF